MREPSAAYTALVARAEREIQASILHMALYGFAPNDWRYNARPPNHLHQGI